MPGLKTCKVGRWPSVSERFWRAVEKSESCWLWVGGFSAPRRVGCAPYGRFYFNGKRIGAHRMSWILAHGDPGDLCVLHKCDVPACVNPEHLFLGTQADNVQDCVNKNRQRSGMVSGPDHGQTKLTAEETDTIKTMYKTGTITQEALGELFGVSQTVISAIVRGDHWTRVYGNLRVAKKQGDKAPSQKLSNRNTSGFKGVLWYQNRWVAQIGADGTCKYLGRYKTADEAARAYDDAAREYFGEFARLNFPNEGERGCR